MSGWNEEEYENYNESDSIQQVETSVDALLEDLNEPATDQAVDVLFEAVQRIEEANLYKHLINTSLFEEGSASPSVLDAVNEEIRQFALSRLQEKLGLATPKSDPVQSVFDKDELMVLKILAAKALNRDVSSVVLQERTPQTTTISSPAVQSKPKTRKVSTTPKIRPAPSQARQAAAHTPNRAVRQSSSSPVQKTSPKSSGVAKPAKGPIKPKNQPNIGQLTALYSKPQKPVINNASEVASPGTLNGLIGAMVGSGGIHIDNSNPVDSLED